VLVFVAIFNVIISSRRTPGGRGEKIFISFVEEEVVAVVEHMVLDYLLFFRVLGHYHYVLGQELVLVVVWVFLFQAFIPPRSF
jgi:hypothetical protein